MNDERADRLCTSGTSSCSQCYRKVKVISTNATASDSNTIEGGGLKKCSRCKRVSYCNRECQKRHWLIHKADCKKWQLENFENHAYDKNGSFPVSQEKKKEYELEEARRLLWLIRHAKNPRSRGARPINVQVRQVAIQAIMLLEGYVKNKKKDSEAHFLLGCAYYLGEDLGRAVLQLNRYNEMVSSSPNSEKLGTSAKSMAKRLHFHAGLLAKMSSVLEQCGEKAQAHDANRASETTLWRTIEIDPTLVSSYIDLSAMLQSRNDRKGLRRLGRLAVSNGSGFWVNEWQLPAHMHYRSTTNNEKVVLTSRAWWEPSHFPWHKRLEEKFPAIRAELQCLLEQQQLRGLWSPVGSDHAPTDAELIQKGGEWTEITLCGGSSKSINLRNQKLCPETTAVLRSIPAAWDMGTVGCGGECLFSSLKPGTRLRPHCGASNLRLTCHLGLNVPSFDGKWSITCGGETRSWEEGKCIFFDDSFEHEVNHDQGVTKKKGEKNAGKTKASQHRIVLLMRFWHPDLPPEEWQAANKTAGESFFDHCAASMEPPLD